MGESFAVESFAPRTKTGEHEGRCQVVSRRDAPAAAGRDAYAPCKVIGWLPCKQRKPRQSFDCRGFRRGLYGGARFGGKAGVTERRGRSR